MLEYIHMKNFQKHEDKRLVFSEGVTYITGANNAGKSCTMRALQWVAMNTGNSKQFRRTYEENGVLKTTPETSVEVGVDGHVVKRVLTSSKNEYYLDGVKLTGFGRGTPKGVSDLFQMSSLNVSAQFSPLFLVGDSGGAVAEELAKIASLEEMDMLSDSVNKDIRSIQDRLAWTKSERQAAEDIVEVLSDSEAELDKSLKTIAELERDLSSIDLEVYPAQRVYEDLLKCPDTASVQDGVTGLMYFFIPDEDLQSPDYSELEFLSKQRVSEISIDQELFEYPVKLPDTYLPTDCTEEIFLVDKVTSLNSQYNDIRHSLADLYDELSEYKACPLCGSMMEECNHV